MAAAESGTVAVRTRTFSQEDFDRFAALSGDDNPIHVDHGYSAATRFGATVAHGMFLYSCLCALMAETFPGASQERQELMFPAPTYTGVEMTLRVEVTEADPEGGTVSTVITDPEGTVTATGEARLRWGPP